MPYKVYKSVVKGDERPWKIYSKDRKKIVGTSKTERDAEASVRARFMGEAQKR
jgi:hypothetical protein